MIFHEVSLSSSTFVIDPSQIALPNLLTFRPPNPVHSLGITRHILFVDPGALSPPCLARSLCSILLLSPPCPVNFLSCLWFLSSKFLARSRRHVWLLSSPSLARSLRRLWLLSPVFPAGSLRQLRRALSVNAGALSPPSWGHGLR
jgi:hypothetical protein